MENRFFRGPAPNSPYEYPPRHWGLDAQGQPTQRIIERRRRAELITPIPKTEKRNGGAAQQYDPTPIINELRARVDQWRALHSPAHWQVTPPVYDMRRFYA